MLLRHCNFPSGQVLELVQGDITEQQVDAIVNAANSQLRHGAGVAGVILRRGGPQVQQMSDVWVRQHGPVSHEQPAYTPASTLLCRYIIHAVGPVWGEGDEDRKLSDAILGSLRCAEKLNLESIALPAISTGVFGFPKDRAARVIYSSLRSFFDRSPSGSLHIVRIVLYDRETVEAFLSVWETFWGEDKY
jgi:O-acetyl-ADP-ribose deacetylase